MFPTAGSLSNGALESAAVLALAEERLDDASGLLAEMKAAVKTPSDWMIYANRHTRLTLVEVIARGGRVDEALAEVEHVLNLRSDRVTANSRCTVRWQRLSCWWEQGAQTKQFRSLAVS